MENLGETILLLLAPLALLLCLYGCTIFLKNICTLNKQQNSQSNISCLKQWQRLFLSFFIVLEGYGCLALSKHYSVDSFNILFDMSPYWHLMLGRYLNCSITLWAIKWGINLVTQQQFLAVLWILSCTAAVFIVDDALQKIFVSKSRCGQGIITLSVSLAFANVFMMEFLLFPEMMLLNVLGVIALGLSIWFALSDFSYFAKGCFSFVFLLIALGNYQGYIGIFEAFVLVSILLKYRNSRKKYSELFSALLIGGFASVINVAVVKILIHVGFIVPSGRDASISIATICRNIIQLCLYQFRFWKSADGLMPLGLMPVIGILLLFCFANIFVTKKIKLYIIVLAVTYILSYAPHLIESSIVLTPRSNIAVWSFIAVGIITGIHFIEEHEHLFAACISVIVVINLFMMQDMAANTQMTNAADFVEADQICAEIAAYENRTGNAVTKIAIDFDESPTLYQEFSRYKVLELGKRILATPYSSYRLLGSRMNRNFEKVDISSGVFSKYFSKKDWSCLNTAEQLVFENDTLYWIVY